jgi:branched-chain amino acid transport system substrate-binding protein
MRKWLIILSIILQFGSAKSDDAIKIGVVLPLTGHTSNFGTEALKGINLAVERYNAAGGVRNSGLKLIVNDNTGDPAATSRVVSEMIEEKNALAIIGPITSTNTAAAAAVAQQAKTPLVSPAATDPYITEIGEYICRICITDPLQSKALAEFTRKYLKSDKVAVLYEKDSRYSENLAQFYAMRLKDMGGQVIFTEGFNSGDDNLPGLVDRALSKKPDLLFAPVYYPEAAAIINHVAELQSSITLLGGDGWESPELFRLSGDNINPGQVFISSHFSIQYAQETGSPFVKDYRQAYGSLPNAMSALGYDAVGVLVDALRRAAVLDKNGLQQALVSTTDFNGVTGKITINEKRNVVKDVYILKALGNEFVLETNISIF